MGYVNFVMIFLIIVICILLLFLVLKKARSSTTVTNQVAKGENITQIIINISGSDYSIPVSDLNQTKNVEPVFKNSVDPDKIKNALRNDDCIQIYKNKSDKYLFRVVSQTYEVLYQSEMYPSIKSCARAVESFIEQFR